MLNSPEPSLLVFSFDGTGSEPRDSQQYSAEQFKEDCEISNVLKLHLLLGGRIHPQAESHFPAQKCFYYSGIGHQGSTVKKVLNQILAPQSCDVASILSHAMHDFEQHYQAGNKVILIGFSRGAALARRFAKCIEKHIDSDVYLCVFDTIASIGFSKITKATCGTEHVIFSDHGVPSNVEAALHCVSLDDKRRAFEATLFNQALNVHEVWFAGSHSDIGGGFYRSGLSDICLRYSLEWLLTQPVQLQVLTREQIDYKSLLPNDGSLLIDADDLAIKPDALAPSHQHDYFWSHINFKATHRLCVVMKDNQVTDIPPIIHHSVAKRIYNNSSYRPESLKGLKHHLEYANGETLECVGINPHIELPTQQLNILQVGECRNIKVYACEPFNYTGLWLEKGATYRIEPISHQVWYDKDTQVTASGWQRDNRTVGVKKLPIEMMEPYKRLPGRPWFSLVGCINADDSQAFSLNGGGDIKVHEHGEFTPFANDICCDYGLNRGAIELEVTRLG
ncbi:MULTISPECIES: T6SS phospholipase effector Tle1-like catalytic domain-containing protein [Pseudoalteromonas]|uniref:T6SS Phospholipase effector Tle1-like catalytic domain-containing protein n=1 Tax=Pseudoalteromonas amylolytica TaxID=1859457 RepID=A0A1S1MT64_9GAMM|nr:MULTISPECIES: DUF2235 domain-containing protein [Pseudoalteromonas]OHU84355.1 hypothetical protein BFC16_01575 [Pseudoalteromonas sp. JW3]OHU87106.1 hypothetical protein BET10_00365 [Pseudoalteromonas amylolytica]